MGAESGVLRAGRFVQPLRKFSSAVEAGWTAVYQMEAERNIPAVAAASGIARLAIEESRERLFLVTMGGFNPQAISYRLSRSCVARVGESAMPSFDSSPWMRGAPQSGFWRGHLVDECANRASRLRAARARDQQLS
jgi:hypothetical protein